MRAEAFNGHILVVDTDHYAGNFERPLCAYVTGCVGECEVGQEEADMFRETVDPDTAKRIASVVVSVPDEHGCHRPASIYPTPGFWNDGLGGHYPDEDWGRPGVIKTFREKVAAERAKSMENAKSWGWDLDKHKPLDHLGYGEDVTPGRYSAYQSVAIFLDSEPDNDLLDLMVERIQEYCKSPPGDFKPDKIEILGIRLVREETVVHEVGRIL